jgi:hypothetical protein
MAVAQRAACIQHHQKHAGVFALCGRFAVADDHAGCEPDQPVLMMGDIRQNSAGLSQTFRTPARINRGVAPRKWHVRAHRRPRAGILRAVSLASSQLRTALRR